MQLAMQVVYYTTLKTQTMAVACPWILGSRLSILLSSLGECEFVRMLLVAVGVDPDISHAAVQDCHVQTKSMFDQAGSSSRTRSAFLSLSPATGRHHTPTGKVAPQAKTACHDHSFAHTPHAQTMSSSGSRRLCSDLRTRGTIISRHDNISLQLLAYACICAVAGDSPRRSNAPWFRQSDSGRTCRGTAQVIWWDQQRITSPGNTLWVFPPPGPQPQA